MGIALKNVGYTNKKELPSMASSLSTVKDLRSKRRPNLTTKTSVFGWPPIIVRAERGTVLRDKSYGIITEYAKKLRKVKGKCFSLW